jgi:hypothetical protein
MPARWHSASWRCYVTHVLDKLGLRDRVHAVVYACETELVEPARDDRKRPVLEQPAGPARPERAPVGQDSAMTAAQAPGPLVVVLHDGRPGHPRRKPDRVEATVVPDASGEYDVVIIAVRRDQLTSACSALAALAGRPAVGSICAAIWSMTIARLANQIWELCAA